MQRFQALSTVLCYILPLITVKGEAPEVYTMNEHLIVFELFFNNLQAILQSLGCAVVHSFM